MTDISVVIAPEVIVVATIQQPQNIAVVLGILGPEGIQGVPGVSGGMLVQFLATIPIGGHRCVVLDTNERALYADNTELSHIGKVLGVTTGAVESEALATIQTGGEMTEPSWSWVLDVPIWLGTNGLLTQTPPATGFSQVIGFPISATKMFISQREPIILS